MGTEMAGMALDNHLETTVGNAGVVIGLAGDSKAQKIGLGIAAIKAFKNCYKTILWTYFISG